MRVFLFILSNNLIPIFALIILGIIIGKKFQLDVSTLSKINLYFFVPSFVFYSVYTTDFPLDMLSALAVVVLIMLLNWIFGFFIGRIRKYDQGFTNAFTNSIMFYNSGNFGIPLITLVFSSKFFLVDGETPYLDYALTIQIVVFIVQNIAMNTLGVFNANRASGGLKGALKKAMNMPALYCVILAFLLKLIPYDLTQIPIWSAISHARDGLISMALFTLGVQLSRTKLKVTDPNVFLSIIVRLVVGPLLALILVLLFGIDGVMAQVLIISSAVPTAVNVALIGVEFKNHPGFVSQVVMVSTVFSAITLTGVIYLAGVLFPV